MPPSCGAATSRPSTALDHLGPAIWLIDEPDEVAAVAEFLQSQADDRRAELERAGELPARWATAYPTPREWKQRCTRRARSS